MREIPQIRLASGERVPVLGLGTAQFGKNATRRKEEIVALQTGLDLGMKVIDTAERYSGGEVEKIVGEAIVDRRDEAFLVSKVSPENATYEGTILACEQSLRRLRTDRLDLYLLHWREDKPLWVAVEAFTRLVASGKIRHWGVSNLDLEEMQDIVALPKGPAVAANQVMYNLRRRGIEYALAPWCHQRQIAIMAYSPLDQGALVRSDELASTAAKYGATAAQVALTWLLQNQRHIIIPKSASAVHVRENRTALDLELDHDDLAALDKSFPPPTHKMPLETT
jgi:diketogulonate reductase-like aldo/keto reductase